jgi:hypothetical protein
MYCLVATSLIIRMAFCLTNGFVPCSVIWLIQYLVLVGTSALQACSWQS